MSKTERVTESYGEMHSRDGDDAISLRSLRFLFFVFFERERVKEREKFESFFLLSSGFVVQRKLLFFSLVKRNKKKQPLLTFFTYYGIYS